MLTVTGVTVMSAAASEHPRLLGFSAITLNGCLRLRNLKIIRRTDGSMIVTMPQEMECDYCPQCRVRNPITCKFCPNCGIGRPSQRARQEASGRTRIWHDICHPLCQEARDEIVGAVLMEWERLRDGDAVDQVKGMLEGQG